MNEVVSSVSCINCGQIIDSSYCPHCGQKNPPKKISLLNLYTDFQARIYGFDGMFPRTIRDLTVRPGEVTRTFVSGNRVKYYGPVGYFFLMVTIFILLLSLLDVSFYEFTQSAGQFGQEVKPGSGQEKVNRDILDMFSNNMRLFFFLLIPIFAFWLWIFFRKSNYNFLETASLVFFTNGHFFWWSIILLVIYKISGIAVNTIISLVLSVTYFAFAASGFYTHQKKVKVVLKAVLAWFTAYVFFILFFSIGFIIYIIMNPEIREMLRTSDK